MLQCLHKGFDGSVKPYYYKVHDFESLNGKVLVYKLWVFSLDKSIHSLTNDIAALSSS